MNPTAAAIDRAASRFLRASLKQGGTVTRTVQGRGWTETEAWTNAMQADEEDRGRDYGGESNIRQSGPAKMIKAPKKPTKVTVTKKEVTKGPVTKKYVIEQRWGFSFRNESPVIRDKRFTAQYDTQGAVLEAAKALALQYGEELRISLQAFCTGNTHLADVKPEAGEMGIWAWKVDFRD